MELPSFFDGEREGFRDRAAVVVLLRGVLHTIQHDRRRSFKAPLVISKGNTDTLAIGGGLFMRERQASERLRQAESCLALRRPPRARHQEISTNFFWPDIDSDRVRDAAPIRCVRSDDDPRSGTTRQE